MPSPWLISGCSVMSLATQLQGALCSRLTGAHMSSFPPRHWPWATLQAPLLLVLMNFGFLFLFFFLKKKKSSTAWTGFESCYVGETELRCLLPTACTSQVLELQTLPSPAGVPLFFEETSQRDWCLTIVV